MEKIYSDDLNGQLAFFSKITSNVSHELNNVNSIINEYTGIIEDNLILAKDGFDVDIDKMIEYKDKILKQIIRSKNLIKQLNYFAHSADEELLQIDLNTSLKNFLPLIKRFVSIREVKFEFNLADNENNKILNLFLLEKLIFNLINIILDYLNHGSQIIINLIESNHNIVVMQIKAVAIDKLRQNELNMKLNKLLIDYKFNIYFDIFNGKHEIDLQIQI